MFAKLRSIVWFTVVEMLSHPATVLLTLANAIGILVLPLLQFQRFSEDGRLARDCGLATMVFLGLLLAIGAGGHLIRTLQDGTCALAFVKPLHRGVWFCGKFLGSVIAIGVCIFTQAVAVLLAEAFSPRYHGLNQSSAQVGSILLAQGCLVLALIIAALGNRLRNTRFTLSASFLMPLLLVGFLPFTEQLHWGIFTVVIALFCLLMQMTALALVVATKVSNGLMTGIVMVSFFAVMRWGQGSAFLPLDALANGGAVSLKVLMYLLPQMLCAVVFCLLLGSRLLRTRAV